MVSVRLFSEKEVLGKGSNIQHEISVNEVVEGLEENGEETEAGQESRKGGHYPVDAGLVARPSEPE